LAEKIDIPVAPLPEAEVPALATGTLVIVALGWLTATMWVSRAFVAGNIGDPAVVISSAALVLPSVIAATLVAGAAAGLAVVNRFVADRPVWSRVLAGALAGAAAGAIGGGAILFGFGTNAAIAVIAGTVVVAGLLAGTSAMLPAPVVAAAVASTLTVFVLGALLNYFQAPLKSMLGAGNTVASQQGAAHLFLIVSAMLVGLAGGLVAYRFLRLRGNGERWPWYLLAGASAGIVGLLGEGLTRIGGASLLRVVGNFSTVDQDIMDFLGAARIESALLIGFTGGLAAMILVGRTMRRPLD
jgi:hypothetical protein